MGANLDLFRFDDKILSDKVLNTKVLGTKVFDNDDKVLGNLKFDNNVVISLIQNDTNSNKKLVKSNEILYITPEPKMPTLEIAISQPIFSLPTKYKTLYAAIEVSHIVNEGQKRRNDISRIPMSNESLLRFSFEDITTVTLSGGIITNPINWNDTFRGGKAVIKVYSDAEGTKQIQEFVFYIRGLNPTKHEVETYLINEGYLSRFWFIKKMLIHESESEDINVMQQFNDPSKSSRYSYGTSGTGRQVLGMPLWGYPDGWGMAQLDYSAERRTVEAEALWNWKRNIDLLVRRLREKVAAMEDSRTYLGGEWVGLVGKVNAFTKANPNTDVATHSTPDKLEGSVTFINCQSQIEDLNQFNNYMSSNRNNERNETTKSFLDADLIRRYNGGRFLYKLYKDDDKVLWEIRDVSSASGNYVEHVCSINE